MGPDGRRWTSRAETRPQPVSSWLIAGAADRERLLDMDRRLRPVRLRTFVVLALALLAAAPWTGWWLIVPLVVAGLLFRLAEGRLEGSAAHPEYWMLAAWVGAEVVIATSLVLTGGTALVMLSLLAVPVVTLSARFSTRGVWVGVAIAAALMIAVALGTDAGAVAANPPLLIAPVTVALALAMLSTALMWSDVEHRGKAGVDPLTGLLNRASLESRVSELEQQSQLTREPVGVVAFDVNEFKKVNDREGHLAGDRVLIEVAEALRGGLRAFDAAYRPGGDEFVVLIPGADLDEARVVGVALHTTIDERLRRGSPTTVSCGVSASAQGEPFVFDRVFGCADGALYRAKANGGFASEPSASSGDHEKTRTDRVSVSSVRG